MLRFEFQTKLWKSTGLTFWVGILYLTAHHRYSQYWWLILRVHPKFVQIIHLKLITWRNTNMVQRWFKSHIRGWWNLSLVKSWSLDQICESNTIKGWPPVLHSTSWLLLRFWKTLNSCWSSQLAPMFTFVNCWLQNNFGKLWIWGDSDYPW